MLSPSVRTNSCRSIVTTTEPSRQSGVLFAGMRHRLDVRDRPRLVFDPDELDLSVQVGSQELVDDLGARDVESLALVPAHDEPPARPVALVVGHVSAEEERGDRNVESTGDPAQRVDRRAREPPFDLGDEALRDAVPARPRPEGSAAARGEVSGFEGRARARRARARSTGRPLPPPSLRAHYNGQAAPARGRFFNTVAIDSPRMLKPAGRWVRVALVSVEDRQRLQSAGRAAQADDCSELRRAGTLHHTVGSPH